MPEAGWLAFCLNYTHSLPNVDSREFTAGLTLIDEKKYDVFLSYNSLDHVLVERVANALKERGCSSFVDRWYLTPGQDWVVALERALQASRSVAVFLGDREMGRWQQRERVWALDQLAGRDDFPVIPVLLPGSEPPLGFMKQLMWIDLRTDPTDSAQLDKLAAAIRQEQYDRDGKPEPRAALCPYRGLLAFREEDADFFFGRQMKVQVVPDELQSKREWYVNHVNMTMLRVPEREFSIGRVDDEKNPSYTDPTEKFDAFWMSDREISVEQFFLVCKRAKRPDDMRDGNLPMNYISWFDAIEFYSYDVGFRVSRTRISF